ncbi:hypothetical protein SALBM311S_04008 [Streptomyces alboniger]
MSDGNSGIVLRKPAIEQLRKPSGLVALALGGFGIGLTEFLIAGLLPQVASKSRCPRRRRGG